MESVLAVVICGLFGFWIWNLKSELNELRKRLDDEDPKVVTYGSYASQPARTREAAKSPAGSTIRNEESTWIIS